MKRRVEAILRLLARAGGYTTIEEIARETYSGVRTIHRDLEMLERSLGFRGVRLERRRGHGIRLIDPLPEGILSGGLPAFSSGGSESRERPLMILLYLIAAGDWIKISELAHVLFVSDSSVGSDLNTLEQMVVPPLVVERQKGVGVRVTGDEYSLRLLYTATFPLIFPLYTLQHLGADYRESRGLPGNGPDRVIISMDYLALERTIQAGIERAESSLGYRFSPVATSLLVGYLVVCMRRAGGGSAVKPLGNPLPRIAISEPCLTAARELLGGIITEDQAELNLLAAVLGACEVAAPPRNGVDRLMGDLAPVVGAVIERTLGVLEEQERAWFHDDRGLLDYLRLTVAAAIRRLDLGIPAWQLKLCSSCVSPEESAEATALLGEFAVAVEPLVGVVQPEIIRRELEEAALAIGARIETVRRRRAAHISVRILCYEGLGMSTYLRSLAREVLPPGARIDARWDPDFAHSPEAGAYDLVVSTYPLELEGIPQLIIDGDITPEVVRSRLRAAVNELVQAGVGSESNALSPLYEEIPDDLNGISLPSIMGMVNGFFVEQRQQAVPLLQQIVELLRQRGGDPVLLGRDFEKRESYGSLVFEEYNVRLVHCRSSGVPAPLAGAIQNGKGDPAVLVLAAPINAPQEETRVLSELVVALSEVPDFPRMIAEDDLATIQGFLLGHFSRRIG